MYCLHNDIFEKLKSVVTLIHTKKLSFSYYFFYKLIYHKERFLRYELSRFIFGIYPDRKYKIPST